MPAKLKTVHEIEDEISDAKDELGESENDEESESGDEIDDVSKQVWLSKRIKRFVTRFFKGFGSGLGVYSGIKIVTALMRNPFRESLPKVPTEILAKDSIRFAAFLGLYPSLYDLTLELLEYYRGKRVIHQTEPSRVHVLGGTSSFTYLSWLLCCCCVPIFITTFPLNLSRTYPWLRYGVLSPVLVTDDWNSAIAGGVSSLALSVEDRTRRRVYCLFAIARAVGALVSTLVRRGYLPDIPFSETYLFGICASFLVYCNALKPQYLFPGYYRSVLKWSRDYTDQKLSKLFREPNKKFLTCADVGLHPDSCEKHAVKDFLQSIPGFVKLYLPIHMAPFIFFKHKMLFKRPKRVIKTLLRNIFWSTAFLTTMVMIAKYVICFLRNLEHRPPPLSPWIPAVAGFATALSLLFERVNRRKELALFLIPHTLYGAYLWAKEKGIVNHIPYSSVFLFAMAMIPVMHAYEREPESLSLLIHSALKFFVGRRQSTVERRRLRRLSEMST